MLQIIIHGVNGKMGQVVAKSAEDMGIEVVAGIDRFTEAADNPFPVFASADECKIRADVIIDFSRPDGLPSLLSLAKKRGISVVVATTGLTDSDKRLLRDYAKDIAVFFSANMSLGVNLQINLIKTAASFLGNDFQVEIIEKHHNQKADAPSGTALALADALADTYKTPHPFVFGREGRAATRSPHEIGIHAVRGGTIVGEHEVSFIGDNEIIQVNHYAQSRRIFAYGALNAARFMLDKAPGFYDMSDLVAQRIAVSTVAAYDAQVMLTVSGVTRNQSAALFDKLAEDDVNIDMISQAYLAGDTAITFTVPADSADAAANAIHTALPACDVSVVRDISKIKLHGIGMERQSGVAAKAFNVLNEAGADILAISTSETEISVCIPSAQKNSALQALSEVFGL